MGKFHDLALTKMSCHKQSRFQLNCWFVLYFPYWKIRMQTWDEVGCDWNVFSWGIWVVRCYESLFIRNRSIIFGARQKMVGSSFQLIISFTTNCVTVGVKVLKLCFTSEFEISRGTDLEHFRKVFPTVQLSATVYPQYLNEYCSDSHAN
jgi:hypothetical protein